MVNLEQQRKFTPAPGTDEATLAYKVRNIGRWRMLQYSGIATFLASGGPLLLSIIDAAVTHNGQMIDTGLEVTTAAYCCVAPLLFSLGWLGKKLTKGSASKLAKKIIDRNEEWNANNSAVASTIPDNPLPQLVRRSRNAGLASGCASAVNHGASIALGLGTLALPFPANLIPATLFVVKGGFTVASENEGRSQVSRMKKARRVS